MTMGTTLEVDSTQVLLYCKKSVLVTKGWKWLGLKMQLYSVAWSTLQHDELVYAIVSTATTHHRADSSFADDSLRQTAGGTASDIVRLFLAKSRGVVKLRTYLACT